MNSNFINTSTFIEKAADKEQYGLTKGYMGDSLIYYLLAKAFKNKRYERRGRKSLENMSDNSASINTLNFQYGFTGIGWAVEWLIQEDLLTGLDSDEILIAIDQASCGAISFKKIEDLTLFTGLLGSLKYFEKRLLNQNSETHRYRKLSNLEAFVLLVDDLESRVIGENGTFDADLLVNGQLTIPTLGNILSTCASAIQLNVSRSILEDILFEAVMFTDRLFSDPLRFSEPKSLAAKNELLDYLYLAFSYLYAAKKYEHPIWEAKAESYIRELSQKVFDINVTSKGLLFKKLSIFCLLYADQPKDEYRNAVLKCLKELSSKDLSSELYMGLGTLVLAELCLNKTTITKNWHELFFVA